MAKIPISVLIPTRNEAANLPRCLSMIRDWADEIVVVDSGSNDGTPEIAARHGAQVLNFTYTGGWPKKRQWALENHSFRNEWVLLLDSDEFLDEPIRHEIAEAIRRPDIDGYWLRFRLWFLGRPLRHGGFDLWKLFLFRVGKGEYERRLQGSQTPLMGDIEVHEHVIVSGAVARLNNPVRHENFNSLYRYIAKHNEYSEWEARSYYEWQQHDGLPAALSGSQAQRRRWLKGKLFRLPGFPLLTFAYHYIVRLGFLDGRPGFIYCVLKGVQRFHSKAKWYELFLQLHPKLDVTDGVRDDDDAARAEGRGYQIDTAKL